MFNACKRGSSSISRVLSFARVTNRLSTPNPLILRVPILSNHKNLLETRWIHVSSALKNQINEGNNAHQRRDVTKFEELAEHNMVHPNIIQEITQSMKLHTLTEVQVATINEGLQGVDIIAQARTGTGKTLGFLIPTIQNILRKSPELASRQRYSKARPSDIRAIIISPTRELAEQIAVEAQKLCHRTDLIVQVAVGGNSKRRMLMKTQREGCHLLVATPGRLMDLLTDDSSGVCAPNLTSLVLDEADRLLDDGFSRDIEEIVKILPDRRVVDRQTLLFSATVPKEVMHLVRKTLKSDFHFVQTVKEGELATHEKVPQNIIIAPGIENWMPILVEISKKALSAQDESHNTSPSEQSKPYKAIVYFTSTAQVKLAYEIIAGLKPENQGSRHPLYPVQLFIINGTMTQEARTRAASNFRRCSSGILFSTDVTARGMDFPGVSHVIQFGLPPNKEQYIHRVGRTGRGDNTGDGFIIIDKNKSIETAKVDMSSSAQIPESIAGIFSQVAQATEASSRRSKEAAYKSSLNNLKTDEQCLALARWTKYGWGFDVPPPISSTLANKLGLRNRPGINIGRPTEFPDEPEPRVSSRGQGGYQDRVGYGSQSGVRSNFRSRGGDRDSFASRGGDRGGFGSRGEDKGGFGNRGGDRGGFRNRTGDRSSFGNRSEDRGGFQNRSEDRGGFQNRSGDRGGFSNRGGDRGGFGNRSGDRGGFERRR
ncbi:ATP-dependent RNA helicase [Blumeria hordei DH14]|uniref:ATP-dependent RNA helicase n=1 Tax=Blumeria graminis f. sp. hordei (strain DH14) TaxID=546991 RepID=N1JKP0_BLUG1|nr:ATP-dependent RNA helicase [Blumeria hordei DH14]